MQDQATYDHHAESIRSALARRVQLEAELRRAQLDVAEACQAATWDRLTLSQVGSILGVSKQAAGQLVARANRADRDAYEDREHSARESRRLLKAVAEVERGLERRSFPCLSCGRFKSKPADRCDFCGDEPVSHNGDEHEFNRAYGYAG